MRIVPQQPPSGKQYMTLVPVATTEEFWLPLSRFDYTSDAKDGCQVLPNKLVFKNVLNMFGYCFKNIVQTSFDFYVFKSFIFLFLDVHICFLISFFFKPCSLSQQQQLPSPLQRVLGPWLQGILWGNPVQVPAGGQQSGVVGLVDWICWRFHQSLTMPCYSMFLFRTWVHRRATWRPRFASHTGFFFCDSMFVHPLRTCWPSFSTCHQFFILCFNKLLFLSRLSFKVLFQNHCNVLFWDFETVGLSYSEIGYVTSEKSAPSPIQLVASVAHAIDAERRQSRNPKLALKDCLTRVCASYNKMATNKKHRLDGPKKAMVYNLCLVSTQYMFCKVVQELWVIKLLCFKQFIVLICFDCFWYLVTV